MLSTKLNCARCSKKSIISKFLMEFKSKVYSIFLKLILNAPKYIAIPSHFIYGYMLFMKWYMTSSWQYKCYFNIHCSIIWMVLVFFVLKQLFSWIALWKKFFFSISFEILIILFGLCYRRYVHLIKFTRNKWSWKWLVEAYKMQMTTIK